jgi:hypothetical protein
MERQVHGVNISAEADENGDAFALLRRSGLPCARQRMWDVSTVRSIGEAHWKRCVHSPCGAKLVSPDHPTVNAAG